MNNIIKARASLILDQPFFASILLAMPISESTEISTFATDGESIIYNKAWAEKLTLNETIFVLAHETMHCIMDHMGRRGAREHNRFNQAADYVINQLLVNERIGTMPAMGLLDAKLVQAGNGTAEGVYKLLPESNSKNKPGTKGGALDSVLDAGSNMGKSKPDAATLAQKSADMKIKVIKAKNAAKMQGKLSAGLERLVDDLIKPVVDWKTVLKKFVSEKARIDYTYARPKRRFLATDLYLPSLSGQRLGKISVAVDCSGSINQELLNKFTSEINAIRQDVTPSEIEIIYFDSKVLKAEKFLADDDIIIKPMGGGGTAFSPVFTYINEQTELPIACVFLTDLYCDDFGPCPEYPVLFTVLENLDSKLKAPFGEILNIKE